MTDMDFDLDLDDNGGLRRVFSGMLRAIRWVVWDWGCEFLAWTVGWFACRLVSIGRFPSVGWNEEEEAAWWEALAVMVVGWAVLGALAWLLLELATA